jgi:hypothetical protein
MWDPASFGPTSLEVYHDVGPSLEVYHCGTQVTPPVGPGYPPMWDPASFALAREVTFRG